MLILKCFLVKHKYADFHVLFGFARSESWLKKEVWLIVDGLSKTFNGWENAKHVSLRANLVHVQHRIYRSRVAIIDSSFKQLRDPKQRVAIITTR